jgi:hypothetical protein
MKTIIPTGPKSRKYPAVTQAKRIPKIPSQAKDEADIEWDPRDQPKERHLRCCRMEVVLHHERRWNIQQDFRRDSVHQQRERAEVEEELLIF